MNGMNMPNSFERGQTNIKAKYYEPEPGIYKVKNSSLTGSGDAKDITGDLFLNENEPGKLSVEFFKPFRGDYWILKVGDDYEYSVVTNPQKTLLWILVKDLKFFDENPLEYENIIEFLNSPSSLEEECSDDESDGDESDEDEGFEDIENNNEMFGSGIIIETFFIPNVRQCRNEITPIFFEQCI